MSQSFLKFYEASGFRILGFCGFRGLGSRPSEFLGFTMFWSCAFRVSGFSVNARSVCSMLWGSVQQPTPSQMIILFVFNKSLARVCSHVIYLWFHAIFLNARSDGERQSLLPGFPQNASRASPCGGIRWEMLLLEMMRVLLESATDIEIEWCLKKPRLTNSVWERQDRGRSSSKKSVLAIEIGNSIGHHCWFC